MPTAADLRLPGVHFLPAPPARALGLPRLDVAAFVGFAQRGPLHTPVAVSDMDEYRAIFGGDLALAREAGSGLVFAHLPGAVAAFFANGGRRCYVVRVAGTAARRSRLRLPRLVTLDQGGAPRLTQVWAASAGRWSAQLQLAGRLQATPMPVDAFAVISGGSLAWTTGSAPGAIQAGDVLRLTFDDGRTWLFPVATATTAAGAGAAAPVTLTAAAAWRQLSGLAASPPPDITAVRRLTLDGAEAAAATAHLSPTPSGFRLDLAGDAVAGMGQDDVLWLAAGGDESFLCPLNTFTAAAADAPPAARATAAALIRLPAEPLPAAPATLAAVERLRFDLLLRLAGEDQPTLTGLAFNRDHPRFWGTLVTLESSPLYEPSPARDSRRLAADVVDLYRRLETGIRLETPLATRRDLLGLAGLLAPASRPGGRDICLPLTLPAIVTEAAFTGPAADDAGRDDLQALTAALFLDPDLVPNPAVQPHVARSLLSEAFNKHYVQNRRLRGLHGLLFIDEVALVSIPELAHRPWQAMAASPEPPPPPPSAPPAPDWSNFLVCTPEVQSPPSPAPTPPAVQTDVQLPQLRPLDQFGFEHPFADLYPTLLAGQHALLNLCQARRDVVAILTLPRHFEKRRCIEWQETWRQRLGLPRQQAVFDEAHELADLSYAAVYHPWLLVADPGAPDGLRAVPADGAICGMIAARELARDAWIAPANAPLQGILGLDPPFSQADWADLFARQFNLVRREPADYRAMSAHTLSDNRLLLQLSVRRLMILLRKLAAERGMDFVFADHDERLRDGVGFALETMLQFMYRRGALAGATPAQAYRVVTDERVNTPRGVDQGRFIAQIQVAPSQPMEFITVLLTRVAEGGLQATEV